MIEIAGFDLSLTETGVSITQDGAASVVTIKTRTADGDKRLNHIRSRCRLLAGGCRLVLIEDLPVHGKAAGLTGMVHGAVRSELIDAGVPYAKVPPASLKKYATGRGNATKTDMAVAALKRGGLEFRNDNECDAWWLWVMAQDYLGSPTIDLPKVQRESLAKIEMRYSV